VLQQRHALLLPRLAALGLPQEPAQGCVQGGRCQACAAAGCSQHVPRA